MDFFTQLDPAICRNYNYIVKLWRTAGVAYEDICQKIQLFVYHCLYFNDNDFYARSQSEKNGFACGL